LEAPLGQRVNVSLLDFTDFSSSSRDPDATCVQYGYALEKTNKKNVSICAAKVVGTAETHGEVAVFTSDANSADIVLVSGTVHANKYNFLLKLTGMQYVIQFILWLVTLASMHAMSSNRT
jgi:hypothetical protein